MFVIDSGRLAANSGDGVPGMRPGLLYVNVTPSPDDCSLNPPKDADPLLPAVVLVCAVAFAPMAARNATPASARSVRLRRRTDDLSYLRLARRPPATTDALVEHSG